MTRSIKILPEYEVLRHYSAAGIRLGSALPVNRLTRPEHYHPATLSRLVAAANRIGFFSSTSNQWVETSRSGEVLGIWPGPEIKGDVVGASLFESGAAILSVQFGRNQAALLRLDRDRSQWVPVEAGSTKVLFGRDGDQAVVGSRPPHIDWITFGN